MKEYSPKGTPPYIQVDKQHILTSRKKHKYHKSEFRYGNYSRTLYFPYEIDVEKANAELKKGILHITLPKLISNNKEIKKLEINE